MSEYKKDLKCDKVILPYGKKCGASPARKVGILEKNLCEVHQKELSKFISIQLGEEE